MRKRQYKKVSKRCCPKCKSKYVLWYFKGIPTGKNSGRRRVLEYFDECYSCGERYKYPTFHWFKYT